jgi:hypothetical protein
MEGNANVSSREEQILDANLVDSVTSARETIELVGLEIYL